MVKEITMQPNLLGVTAQHACQAYANKQHTPNYFLQYRLTQQHFTSQVSTHCASTLTSRCSVQFFRFLFLYTSRGSLAMWTRVLALPCVQQAGHPEKHWDVMIMLGPEGAQLPAVTPAGTDTATGGPWPIPRPAPLQIRHKITPEGDTYRGERERDREKTCVGRCANCKEGWDNN